MKRTVLIQLLYLLTCTAVILSGHHANGQIDTIILKSGMTLKGEITKFSKDTIYLLQKGYSNSSPVLSRKVKRIQSANISYTKHFSNSQDLYIDVGQEFFGLRRVGMKYRSGNFQLRASWSPGLLQKKAIREYNFSGFSIGIQAHFGGRSAYTNHNPWYVNIGYRNYMEKASESREIIYQDHLLTLLLGREFNLSKRVGFYLNAGILYDTGARRGWLYLPVLPNLDAGIFCRISND